MTLKHIVGLKLKRIFVLLICATGFFVVVYVIYHSNHKHELPGLVDSNVVYRKSQVYEAKTWPSDGRQVGGIVPEKYNEQEVRMRIIQEKVKRLTSTSNENRRVAAAKHKKKGGGNKATGGKNQAKADEELDNEKYFVRHVQIFYYAPVAWYKLDTRHSHFKRVYDNNTVLYKSDELLNIAFYPERGLYDASGKKVFHEHFQEIRATGVGVIILSWTPLMPKHLLSTIFMIAHQYDLRVAIQIEDYAARTVDSVRLDMKFLIDHYGNHLGLERMFVLEKQKYLPIFYIRDAYLIADADWRKVAARTGSLSVRDTMYDALLIAQIS
jgi:glycoprotein endo-alpha-1,2-mannosidase